MRRRCHLRDTGRIGAGAPALNIPRMPSRFPACTRRTVLALPGAVWWAAQAGAATAAAPDEVTVFAAASLTDALRAVAKAGGFAGVRFSFASSSTLSRQIGQGAPAEIFISADLPWMDALQRAGAVLPGTRRDLASNRLALVEPGGGEPVAVPEGEAAVRQRLQAVLETEGARIATGDPAHVPAGQYARAALVSLRLWDAVGPRLARADNVRGALALVERGEAPLGIVYRTDALQSSRVRLSALFPPASHPPIRYPVALLRGARPAAHRFYQHLFSPAAQATLRAAGFGPPDAP